MPYQMEIDPELSRATFEVSGVLQATEVFQMIRDMLDHPDFVEGYDAVVDFTGVEEISASGDDIREKAERDKKLLPRVGSARWALVATRDVVFGFARMFQLSMGDTSVEVAVFRDLKEAEQWLAER